MAAPAIVGAAPSEQGFWANAPRFAIVMMAVFGVRLHEVLPLVGYLRPALLLSTVGMAFLLWRSSPEAIKSAVNDRTFVLILAYFGWAALTSPWAIWRAHSIASLMLVVPVAALTLSELLCAPTRRNVDRLALGFAISASLLAADLLLFGKDIMGRMSGTGMLDSNDIAALFSMAFPFAAAAALRAGPALRRVVAALAAIVLVLAILASASRGGALALVAGVLTLTFGLRGGRRWFALALFVLSGYLAVEFGPATFRERIATLTTINEDYNFQDFGGRQQIWKRGRMYYRQHPIAGVGIGNFETAEGNYMRSIGVHGKWSAPHNAYIQAFSELGTVGGLIFLALLASLASSSLTLWGRQRADTSGRRGVPVGPAPPQIHAPEYLAALVAYCLGAYFLSLAYFYALFGLAGLVSVAVRAARAEQGLPLDAATSAERAPRARVVTRVAAPTPADAAVPVAPAPAAGVVRPGIGWRSARSAFRRRGPSGGR
ncbi:MAG TPA: O-antigen ligase family protein [Gemmatimonadaceae bacterium]|nr:O-antigen ligase family protein [Gemmatimonadaceae bacterium]